MVSRPATPTGLFGHLVEPSVADWGRPCEVRALGVQRSVGGLREGTVAKQEVDVDLGPLDRARSDLRAETAVADPNALELGHRRGRAGHRRGGGGIEHEVGQHWDADGIKKGWHTAGTATTTE